MSKAERYPSALCIGSYVLQVLFISREEMDKRWKEEGDEESADGYWTMRKASIFISTDLSEQRTWEVYNHEIAEAMNDIYDLGFDHHQITVIGSAYAQAFKPF